MNTSVMAMTIEKKNQFHNEKNAKKAKGGYPKVKKNTGNGKTSSSQRRVIYFVSMEELQVTIGRSVGRFTPNSS